MFIMQQPTTHEFQPPPLRPPPAPLQRPSRAGPSWAAIPGRRAWPRTSLALSRWAGLFLEAPRPSRNKNRGGRGENPNQKTHGFFGGSKKNSGGEPKPKKTRVVLGFLESWPQSSFPLGGLVRWWIEIIQWFGGPLQKSRLQIHIRTANPNHQLRGTSQNPSQKNTGGSHRCPK